MWNSLPTACQAVSHIVETQEKVFQGWPPGEAKQTNPDCLFGKILGWLPAKRVSYTLKKNGV
jgi:LPS sulfotransferase NodH